MYTCHKSLYTIPMSISTLNTFIYSLFTYLYTFTNLSVEESSISGLFFRFYHQSSTICQDKEQTIWSTRIHHQRRLNLKPSKNKLVT